MKRQFTIALIAILGIAVSTFAGTPTEPVKKNTVTELNLAAVDIAPDNAVEITIAEPINNIAKKKQRLWEPVQNEYGYTMYYAEYQMVWIGYPVYQEVKEYTGTCKSLNGTTWNCSM